ncbi:putative cupin superfamily sugar epimerase [Microbacteriaceae bacterium SG_E_30_P1]|uniref:Cupin superfamily sugar epimerase n=1 Tax=Antiquaquibacter oligotrophicus TaxID=2880260 RepID=A0ABT6KNP4_9MICO|nr:cupin domain-containing protein [Antiquaquibacter oligotrophicus]MDH6180789.1 putative cupin superfamily sugar epimerase [Antiquaquibacter oligotrophicus]UDF13492.1 cupin domain-containing protein [Antiquaquibacter oligotrophicus]
MTRATAQQVIDALGLTPAQTCGYVRVTYTSSLELAAHALPSPLQSPRPVGTALYFLVAPEAPVRLHRIRNDQLYHYYAGDPLELLLLLEDGTSSRHTIGPDILGGHNVQLLIPGGTFHTARVAGDWFLGGSTESPGVVPEDVELGDPDALALRHPDVAELIRTYPLPATGEPRGSVPPDPATRR